MCGNRPTQLEDGVAIQLFGSRLPPKGQLSALRVAVAAFGDADSSVTDGRLANAALSFVEQFLKERATVWMLIDSSSSSSEVGAIRQSSARDNRFHCKGPHTWDAAETLKGVLDLVIVIADASESGASNLAIKLKPLAAGTTVVVLGSSDVICSAVFNALGITGDQSAENKFHDHVETLFGDSHHASLQGIPRGSDRTSCVDRGRLRRIVSMVRIGKLQTWGVQSEACGGDGKETRHLLSAAWFELEKQLSECEVPDSRASIRSRSELDLSRLTLPNYRNGHSSACSGDAPIADKGDSECDVLAIFAHPDDEAMFAGGTMALLTRAGLRVAVCCVTPGGGGRNSLGQASQCGKEHEVANGRLMKDEALQTSYRDSLESIRAREHREACRALGIDVDTDLEYLTGFADTGKYEDASTMKTLPLTAASALNSWCSRSCSSLSTLPVASGLSRLVHALADVLRRRRPKAILTFHPVVDPGYSLHGHHLAVGVGTLLACHVASVDDGPRGAAKYHVPRCWATVPHHPELDGGVVVPLDDDTVNLKIRALRSHISQAYSFERSISSLLSRDAALMGERWVSLLDGSQLGETEGRKCVRQLGSPWTALETLVGYMPFDECGCTNGSCAFGDACRDVTIDGDVGAPLHSRVPFRVTPHELSPLTVSVAHYSARVSAEDHANERPDDGTANWLRDLHERILSREYQRQSLCDVLSEQNCRSVASLAAVERLRRDKRCVVVATGQQCGALGGPLYTFAKAVSAVQRAESLGQLGIPAVAVFWCCSHDHDVAEVSEIGRVLHRREQGGCVGAEDSDASADYLGASPSSGVCYTKDSVKRTADGTSPDLLPVKSVLLGSDIQRFKQLAQNAYPELFGQCSADNGNIVDGERLLGHRTDFVTHFHGLMQHLCGDLGLIVFDPFVPEVHQMAWPLFCRELQAACVGRETAADIVCNAMAACLADESTKPPVPCRRDMVGLFWHDELGRRLGMRRRADGGGVELLHSCSSNSEVTKQVELVPSSRLLSRSPLDFSPRWYMRPLMQDFLMPTLIHIGGPGEARYMRQVTPLYDWAGIVRPRFEARASFTILNRGDSAAIQQVCNADSFWRPDEMHGLDVETLLSKRLDLESAAAGRVQPLGATAAMQHLESLIGSDVATPNAVQSGAESALRFASLALARCLAGDGCGDTTCACGNPAVTPFLGSPGSGAMCALQAFLDVVERQSSSSTAAKNRSCKRAFQKLKAKIAQNARRAAENADRRKGNALSLALTWCFPGESDCAGGRQDRMLSFAACSARFRRVVGGGGAALVHLLLEALRSVDGNYDGSSAKRRHLVITFDDGCSPAPLRNACCDGWERNSLQVAPESCRFADQPSREHTRSAADGTREHQSAEEGSAPQVGLRQLDGQLWRQRVLKSRCQLAVAALECGASLQYCQDGARALTLTESNPRVGMLTFGRQGGSTTVAFKWCSALLARGVPVHVLSAASDADDDAASSAHPLIDGLVMHLVPGMPSSPLASPSFCVDPLSERKVGIAATRIAAVCREHQLNVLIVHHAALLHPVLKARSILRSTMSMHVRVCVVLHGTDVLLNEPSQPRIDAGSRLEPGDVVVAISRYLYERARQTQHWAACSAIVPNTINGHVFRPGMYSAQFRLSLEGAQSPEVGSMVADPVLLVGYVSNFRPVKRPLDAIRVVAALRDVHKLPVSLVAVGDGPLRRRSSGLAAELNVPALFVGSLPEFEVARHVAACDLVLVVSEVESFSLTAAEALSCGVPVVSTANGGVSELLQFARVGREPRLEVLSSPPVGSISEIASCCARVLEGAISNNGLFGETSSSKSTDTPARGDERCIGDDMYKYAQSAGPTLAARLEGDFNVAFDDLCERLLRKTTS